MRGARRHEIHTKGATNPHDAYYSYYEVGALHAVTSGDGRWKLQHKYRSMAGRQGGTNGIPAKAGEGKVREIELYDLKADISESKNVAARNPDVVKTMLALAESARTDLGDALTGRKGAGVREPGRLPEP